MAIQVESSSSSLSFTKYRYDVFLSFRGEDTRKSFTVFLYEALRRKGIIAFIDDKKLGKGEEISPTLLKAIERSRISIIVFSRNYATSTWCLEELAHIIWCKKRKNQLVMPIFYKVDPEDVQYQRNSFQEAMVALEDRFRDDPGKVQKWRSALSKAASLSSAWLFDDGCEFGFIERIAEAVYAMLPPKPYHNIEHMVGLEPRVKKVISLLNKSDKGVCMLGIHGTGGIGKTTLAKEIYYSIFSQFEGACFLFNVREASKKFQGIVNLQKKLLSEILEEKIMRFGSADEGISKIKHRLSHRRVLLVLDDVDDIEQLERLAGSWVWFGCGSKVIITTRDKQLLTAHNVERTYELMELNVHDSLELFCWHAFHMGLPPKDYQQMSSHVIRYAKGLPLALKLIGANLANKSLKEWRAALELYDRIPEHSIHEVLKISYDCLQDGAKIIFLDIACFFKEEIMGSIDKIAEVCDYGARFYIEVLIEKSLLVINDNDRLSMHDLIKQMAREIVRKEASKPGKRSRLWNYKDVLNVLQENSGTSNIEGILFDPPQQVEVKWSGLAFRKMTNLRILIIRKAQFSTGPKCLPDSLRWLEWEGYPSTKLPSNFSPNKLIFFKLCCSPFRLEEPLKRFEYLTCMNFSHCEFITEIPDMSQIQSLRRLLLKDCSNLIKVHDSVGFLSKLVALYVGGCVKLTSFPHEINMPSLEIIDMSHCKSLDYFPHIVGKMDSLTDVCVEDTSIKELPPSIGNLAALESLNLSSCKNLRELPTSLFMLKNLDWLDLEGIQPDSRKSLRTLMQESQSVISCTNVQFLMLKDCCLQDEDVLLTLNLFRNLIELNLSGNDFVSLPECLKECRKLLKFDVNNCKKPRHIPKLPSNLLKMEAENCISLTSESLGHLWSQAKRESGGMSITLPATSFPNWFHNWCEGGKMSFLAGRNFPHVAFAFELGIANTTRRQFFHFSLTINGLVLQSRYDGITIRHGQMSLFNLGLAFEGEDWRWVQRFMLLDWNDVEIQVTCVTPDIPVVKCGVYVYQQHMENIKFKFPMVSMDVPTTTSLKRRAMALPPNEPAKKVLRKFKVADKGKTYHTKEASSCASTY